MSRRIAVVVAHPDDEVLGCGGTLKRHTLEGDEVHTVILADGESSRSLGDMPLSDSEIESQIVNRRAAAREVATILGVHQAHFHDFPDNALDTRALLDVIRVVEAHIQQIAPEIVYTHHAGDVNVDHRLVHQAVITACRPVPNHSVRRLLFFETASSTEWQPAHSAQNFLPNWFVDIGATLEHKIAALKCYADEMRVWPHARSYEAIEHLARWRGAMIGCAAAEAFVLGREIVRG